MTHFLYDQTTHTAITGKTYSHNQSAELRYQVTHSLCHLIVDKLWKAVRDMQI